MLHLSFKKSVISTFAILFSITSFSSFANTPSPVVLDDNSLHWMKVPADSNLQYSVLAGNPNKNGLFTIRIRLPKNYTDVVHQHPTPQYDTLISGSYYLSDGDNADKSSATKLTPGTFILIPAKFKHIGWTEEGAVMQITTMGPWQGLKTTRRG